MPIGIFEIDTEGKITFANQATYQMTGYSQNDPKGGLNILQIIAPKDRDRALLRSQQVLKGEYTDGNEYQIIRKSGVAFPAFINTRPSIDESVQGLIGYILISLGLKRLKKHFEKVRKNLPGPRKWNLLDF